MRWITTDAAIDALNGSRTQSLCDDIGYALKTLMSWALTLRMMGNGHSENIDTSSASGGDIAFAFGVSKPYE